VQSERTVTLDDDAVEDSRDEVSPLLGCRLDALAGLRIDEAAAMLKLTARDPVRKQVDRGGKRLRLVSFADKFRALLRKPFLLLAEPVALSQVVRLVEHTASEQVDDARLLALDVRERGIDSGEPFSRIGERSLDLLELGLSVR
jgi:hypothetical protein